MLRLRRGVRGRTLEPAAKQQRQQRARQRFELRLVGDAGTRTGAGAGQQQARAIGDFGSGARGRFAG